MKRMQWAWLMVAACLCFTAPARPQMGGMMRPPTMQGVFNPVVGSGSAYEMTDKKQQKSTMEITVVGKETVNGKDAFWMETGVQDPKSGTPMYMKMLIAPTEGNAVTERMTQSVERLAQRGAGMLLVELGPEQAQERVAPDKYVDEVKGGVG